MKIRYMREFCLLADVKNFTIAADRLFITQPALSRHLVTLEQEFGEKLIIRDTHKVELTEAGKLLQKEFQKILDQYDQIEGKMKKIRDSYQGKLKLGTLYYVVKEYAYPTMAKLRRNYPQIQIIMNSYQPHQLMADLIGKKIDIGFVMNVPTKHDYLLRFHKIGRERFVVMLPRQEDVGETISIRDVIKRPLVFSKVDQEMNEYVFTLLRQYNFKPNHIVETDHVDTMIYSVLECNGAAIVPWAVKNIQNDEVKYVEIEEAEFDFDVSWAYRYDNNNEAVATFIQGVSLAE